METYTDGADVEHCDNCDAPMDACSCWNHPSARGGFEELALKLTSYGVPPTVAVEVLTWAYQAAADNRPPHTDMLDERKRIVASLREEIQWQQEMYGDGKDRVAMGRLIGMKDALQTVLKGNDDT